MALNLIKKWFIKRNLLSDKDNTGITKTTALDLDDYIQYRIDNTPTVLPYKVYTALLTQTGTDAPVPIVLENTLGSTPIWTYDSAVGQYICQDIGTFTAGKTTIALNGFIQPEGAGIAATLVIDNLPDSFLFISTDSSTNPIEWGNLPVATLLSIEIRVYP